MQKLIDNIPNFFQIEEIEDKLKKDATKYFKITYPRNLMETIDMKVIVKNTILINGVNEQTEHFIFAKENSHLFD